MKDWGKEARIGDILVFSIDRPKPMNNLASHLFSGTL